MFSTLRTRFGIPGVISVIALVFAMFGGAYAASNSSGGGKATASAKAKKGPRGPKGATGPAGPAGAQGLAGAKGDAGANGTNGTNGKDGAEGKQGPEGKAGTSVVSSTEPTGANCEKGGSKFVAGASTTYACNGKDGLSGFTETLPSGKSETGTWSLYVPASTEGYSYYISIPFAIPLEKAGTEAFFFTKEQVEEEEFGTSGCSWSFENAEKRPESTKKGVLCVFRGEEVFFNKVSKAFIQNPSDVEKLGYGPSGASIWLERESVAEAKPLLARGTWAVTAP